MSDNRPDRSALELRGASEHLSYEARMLLGTCLTMQTIRTGDESDVRWWALKNALLESFVVHARALLDFLYPPSRPWPDDVIADDYLRSAEWASKRPAKSALLRAVHERAGKEIVHLTYERIGRADNKGWDDLLIAAEIGRVLVEFVGLVPAENLLDTVRPVIAEVARGLAALAPAASNSRQPLSVASTSSADEAAVIIPDLSATQGWRPGR